MRRLLSLLSPIRAVRRCAICASGIGNCLLLIGQGWRSYSRYPGRDAMGVAGQFLRILGRRAGFMTGSDDGHIKSSVCFLVPSNIAVLSWR
ncbi:hypothetical protein D3C84_525000 [compost metagenome]